MMTIRLTKLFPGFFIMLVLSGTGFSQNKLPKFEVGVQFSVLSLNNPDGLRRHPIDPGFIGVMAGTGRRTEPGVGGRFTYNLTNNVAFEAEGNLYPRSESDLTKPSGRIFQGQFGVKAGKRFRRFGIFGKARPGFVGFTQVTKLLSTTTTAPAGPLNQVFTVGTFGSGSKAYFSADLGGVFEYYASSKVFARFDLGDSIVRYQSFPGQGAFLSQAIIVRPPQTKHNLQFTAGVGFRF